MDQHQTLTPQARAAVDRLAYTVSEACEATTLGRSKLLELLYDGTIPSMMVGRRRLIPASALRAFVDGGQTSYRVNDRT